MSPSSLRAFASRTLGYRWALAGFLAVFVPFRIATLSAWDDAFYMAQLTSVAADGDLLLHDDLLAFRNPPELRLRTLTTILDSGALHNTFSIGPAVLHSGYTWPLFFPSTAKAERWPSLRLVLALGSMLLLVLTVLMTAECLRRLGIMDDVAKLCAGLAVFVGPLALYGTRVHLGSHLPSAFLAAGLLLGFLLWIENGSPRDAAFVGLTAGLLVINRWQDVVLVGGLAPATVMALRREELRRGRSAGLLLGALVFGATVALQARAWQIQFGSPFLVPQGEGYLQWARPNLVPFLFSAYHGLLPWMPGFALGLGGLVVLRARMHGLRRSLLGGLLLSVLAMLYVSACPQDWWGQASYGPRRLTSLTPLAAMGLAILVAGLRPWLRGIIAAGLLAWTVVTASAHMSGVDDLSVFLFGRPDRFTPEARDAVHKTVWIDRWGPLHYLKPGFTFKDKPGNPDRLVGALATAGMLLCAWSLCSLARRHDGFRNLILAAAGLWIAAWTVRLMDAPVNAPWNGAWREVVRGPCPDLARLAPETAPAARAVLALRALYAGETTEATRYLEHGDAGSTDGLRLAELRELAARTRSSPLVPPLASAACLDARARGLGSLETP